MSNFYTVLLQIHSGNCLQKIGILDLSLIKLLQNEQGCNFLPHSVDGYTQAARIAEKLNSHFLDSCFDSYCDKSSLSNYVCTWTLHHV